jgi:hypothetical protein
MDSLAHAHGSGIRLWWSASDTSSAYVYARLPSASNTTDSAGLEVATTGRTSFSQITNVNAYSFTTDNVLVSAGQVVVFRYRNNGTYGALRFGSAGWDGSAWRANMTWIFAGHSSNLSTVP